MCLEINYACNDFASTTSATGQCGELFGAEQPQIFRNAPMTSKGSAAMFVKHNAIVRTVY